MTDWATVAVTFAERLRQAGLPVATQQAARFADALAVQAPEQRTGLYWTARVTLVADRDDLAVFDTVFDRVFGGRSHPAEARGPSARPPTTAPARRPPATQHTHRLPATLPSCRPPDRSPATPAELAEEAAARPGAAYPPNAFREGADETPGDEPATTAASREERLAHTDFAALDPAELAGLYQLMAALRVAPPLRPGRRTRTRRRGERTDVRATLARARRSGGDPVTLWRRRSQLRRRRVVLLCDISGSMQPYARAYLQFAHATVGGTRAEVFTFATRLTRLTRILATTRHPGEALARAGTQAPDWHGGTRIGEALKEFLDVHGRRGVARGAVVVVLSDGWERDDPALLGEQMARLRRLAHRIVWVNPRRADPRYQPLTGGMTAALPFCDALLSGHSVAALADVAAALGRDGPARVSGFAPWR